MHNRLLTRHAARGLLIVGTIACSNDAASTDVTSDTTAEVQGDGEPGDGDGEPGDTESGDTESGDGEPGDGDSGDGETGDGDPENPYCGDGNVDPGEECDDANMVDIDACTNACTNAVCGDGTLYEGGEECDDGNVVNTDDCLDTCALPYCGDGYVWANNEVCDDANMQANDGCENDCSITAGALKITRGRYFTCALFWDGQVKCWGYNSEGQSGRANSTVIGDDEFPSSIGFIDLGGSATDIEAGMYHVCALLDDKTVRCWGRASAGQLGYGVTAIIGDNESPASAGPVSVGDDVVALALGSEHTCVLTDLHRVRCWGHGGYGQLGLANSNSVGDNELPSAVNPIIVGDDTVQIAAGEYHTCALLAGGGVRCWGRNNYGQLGYGNTIQIGDTEHPNSVGTVSLGNTPVRTINSGPNHTCVLYDDDTARCWGYNAHGELGQGNTTQIGDDELPSSISTISAGGSINVLQATYRNTCVMIASEIKCWGHGAEGLNARGNTATLGDNEIPSTFPAINLGVVPTALSTGLGGQHMCALGGANLRCWGRAAEGQLGYGNTNIIGDNETPGSAGNVFYF